MHWSINFYFLCENKQPSLLLRDCRALEVFLWLMLLSGELRKVCLQQTGDVRKYFHLITENYVSFCCSPPQ